MASSQPANGEPLVVSDVLDQHEGAHVGKLVPPGIAEGTAKGMQIVTPTDDACSDSPLVHLPSHAAEGTQKRTQVSPFRAQGSQHEGSPRSTSPRRPGKGLTRQNTAARLGLRVPSARVLPKLRPSLEFQRQAKFLRRQLKNRDQDRVWVIDPRDSRVLSIWDGITTAALVYTAVLTPFEVGFLSASTTVDAWFVINRILDVIFILDMCLQFCVVYQKAQERAEGDDAAFVTERRKIVRHYLFGWFPLDLFSILPSIFDIVPLVEAGNDNLDAAATAEKLTGFRAVRALRLIKLIRLLRASRLLARWQARIGLSHSTLTVLRIIVFMLIACHWYACIFALQAVLHDDPAVTWLGLQGHCSDVPISPGSNIAPHQVFAHQCASLDLPSFYLAAVSWSAMIITGLGGTDWYPSQDNAETMIVTVMVVLGALMWAKVLATFCELATNADPASLEYRQALDDLNRFCTSQGLSTDLKRRLRQFFHQRKHIMLSKSSAGVIHKMSTSLQIEVVMLVHKHWLRHIWFLRGAEPACLVQLALRMEPCVFAPGELPEADHLYVLHRGIVMHGLRVLTSGKMWGEEMIVGEGRDSTVVAPALARCMTYVEVYSLNKAVFFRVINAFDDARRLVRRGAVLLIARRGVVKLVKTLRKQREGGDSRGFIDMILDAANKAAGQIARVNQSEDASGGISLALRDDISSTKAHVEALSEEMAAMREGLNRLLQKEGLKPIQGTTSTET